MRVWLLEGGSFHGAVQVPILEHLIEHERLPDCIYGTSVGAINGVLAAANDIETLKLIWTSLDDKSWFFGVNGIMSFSIWHRKGIYSLGPLARKLRRHVSLKNLLTVFGAGIVTREDGEYRVLRSDKMFEDHELRLAVLASSAMAGIHEPYRVQIGKDRLIGSDGGHRHVIPVPPSGVTEVVAILTAPVNERVQPTSAVDGLKDAVLWGMEVALDNARYRDILDLRALASTGVRVRVYFPRERFGSMFDADSATIRQRFLLGHDAISTPATL